MHKAARRIDPHPILVTQNENSRFSDPFNTDEVFSTHTNDLGGLGCEIGIVAFAPRLATREIDFLRAQKNAELLGVDLAERLCEQRSGPAGLASGWLLVEQS